MNSVLFAERARVAKHEAVHAAASIFLGIIPDEVRILPLADGESGYVQGECLTTAKPSVNAVVLAAGIRDGHGVVGDEEGDVWQLEQLVPDADRRAEVLEVADRVMAARPFKAVANALRRRLQFTDVMRRDEIAKIAAAAGLQVSRV